MNPGEVVAFAANAFGAKLRMGFCTSAIAPMTALVPLFEKHGVSAAFFGHDHNYQHYLRNGIHYVITGGGGAPLYDVDKPPEGITQKVVSIENFVRGNVDSTGLHVEAIAIDGRTLDKFAIPAAVKGP